MYGKWTLTEIQETAQNLIMKSIWISRPHYIKDTFNIKIQTSVFSTRDNIAEELYDINYANTIHV